MSFFLFFSLVALLAALVSTSPIQPGTDPVDILTNESLDQLAAFKKLHPSSNCTCTVKNAVVRREWGALTLPGLKPQSGNGLMDNPRCLRRDISKYFSMHWTKTSDVTGLIQNHMGRRLLPEYPARLHGLYNKVGVHGAGHYTVGGDPRCDFYVSTNDPAFFVHHAMVDRVFWIWQNRDLEHRRDVMAGHLTMLNDPPSRNAMLDDFVDVN